MSIDENDRKQNQYHFDRHTPDYRHNFEAITEEMHAACPLAWSDTYGGHWVAAGAQEVFELARSADYLSNDHDIRNERRGYRGISIPTPQRVASARGGFLEMDPPEQRYYRQALNPYLSPAAINRWVPVIDELVRASLDEKIETGRIDFVDDLANIVPAVFTLAMMGIPLKNWTIYCEPLHAAIYTRDGTEEAARVTALHRQMGVDLATQLARDSLTEARRSVRAMQPGQLETARLPEALAGVAGKFTRIHGVPASVTTTGQPRRIRPEAEITLLRAAQEALVNVARHARAGKVVLTLSYMEDQVNLDIRDDGVGFEPQPAGAMVPARAGGGGYGLLAMRQRIEGVAGTLEVESAPGGGTAISASVPTDGGW